MYERSDRVNIKEEQPEPDGQPRKDPESFPEPGRSAIAWRY